MESPIKNFLQNRLKCLMLSFLRDFHLVSQLLREPPALFYLRYLTSLKHNSTYREGMFNLCEPPKKNIVMGQTNTYLQIRWPLVCYVKH